MQVIDWPDFLKSGLQSGEKKSSMTVGVFDGVHRGHQRLIERIVSHNTGYLPVIVTFRENRKKEEADNIQSFDQKLKIFESLGIKTTLAVDFTDTFRRTAGIEFLEHLLKHGNIGFFAAGSDFRCGYQLDTDAAAIQKFFEAQGIPAEIVPDVMESGLPISSSRIRSAIACGDLALAEKMLGRPL